ncbi:phage tail sheath C-terminal domain-containing protein [Rouxiella sp. WC2420]|uniref:Phage tail sheath C-terminal domain-containing protein n=1 Tax=Rouxiella sp. WC2420 TaxID=3234145 RepID=A0AB39VYQ7_9GAMM
MSIIPAIAVNQNIENHPIGENETVVPVFIYLSASASTFSSKLQLVADYDPLSVFVKSLINKQPITNNALKLYFDNGGGPCFVYEMPYTAELINVTSQTDYASLLAPLLQQPEITLLAVTDLQLLDVVKDDDKTGKNYAAFWTHLLEAVAVRKDIFCLIDAPASIAACKAFKAAMGKVNTSFAAAYWPHLVCDYPVNATLTPSEWAILPPSPAVAAVMYKTDRDVGIWKAPANLEIEHIVSPQFDMSYGDDVFTDDEPASKTSRLNYILSFAGFGTRIWGCRTLQSDATKGMLYIQQRRLMTFIERNMRELANFMMFEPNNEMTWYKYKGVANDWLRQLWKSGGLFGDSEEQAWKLEMGLNETMTVEDIKHGIIRITISVKILNPVEFIDLKLTLSINQPTALVNSGLQQYEVSQ